ncbi:MAG TPA: YceI family protein, partial [Thermomicrobiales bacterium]|nr:YceI family protein [Thermomicrobiales bacterium]
MAIWQIDPSHSSAEFAVKHLMISTVKGRFSDLSGTVNYDPTNLAASSVNVQIGIASVDTHDEKRDAHLRSGDFFDSEAFPVMTFASTAVKPVDSETFNVVGDLTIKGVTHEVTLKAELGGIGTSPWGSEVAAFSATTSIDRKDFGLNWNVGL